jgi:hypothetical protein
MRTRTTLGIIGTAVALLALGSQPLLAAEPSPSAATVFGSDLSSFPFPSETGGDNPQTCDEDPDATCLRVMTQAYGANGKLKAPRDGTIKAIRIIALEDGSARLFLARLDPNDPFSARVTRKGPAFSYQGQPEDSDEVFVNYIDIPDVAVKRYEVLALRAVRLSALRGGSGGNRHLEFQPIPAVGGSFTEADDDNSYHMLIQAIYK